AALARRSPSDRLYSSVPRSSQWPSIRMRASALARSHRAFASRISASRGRIAYLSKSKCTSTRSRTAENSTGAGRASDAPDRVAPASDPVPSLAVGCGDVEALDSGDTPLAPVGAGAAVVIVAGCLAQPNISTVVAPSTTAIDPYLVIAPFSRPVTGRHRGVDATPVRLDQLASRMPPQSAWPNVRLGLSNALTSCLPFTTLPH